MNFAIIGMGYVGLTLAVHLCKRGHQVAGIDRNLDVVNGIREGTTHIVEDGINDALHSAWESGRLTGHSGVLELKKTQFVLNSPTTYIITVGTPAKNGEVDLSAVFDIAEDLITMVKPGDLVLLRSTVAVGTTRRVADLINNPHVLVGFIPERTVEGRAISELQNLPQVLGVHQYGIYDSVAPIEAVHAITDDVVQTNTAEEAELAKLVCNTERDMAFAYANQIANVCDDLGISFNQVRRAATQGYDRCKLARPGPVAGPCLTKDTSILQASVSDSSLVFLSTAARNYNELVLTKVQELIQHLNPAEAKVAILGLAFKGHPATGDMRDSPSLTVIRYLAEAGFLNVTAYDKNVTETEFDSYVKHEMCFYHDRYDATLMAANLVLVMHDGLLLLPSDFSSYQLAENAQIYSFVTSSQKIRITERPDVAITIFGEGTK